MSESPPSLRETLSGGVGFAVVALYLLAVVYSVVLRGNVLVVVWLGLVAFSLWLFYRFVVAHERIAVAQARRADASERRARAAESRAGTDRSGAGRNDTARGDDTGDTADASDDSDER